MLILSTVLFSVAISHAQEIKIETNAPDKVSVGEEFYLSFTLNREVEDIILDSVFTDFKLIKGPIKSSSRSYTSLKGKATKTVKISSKYKLVAQKTGSLQLPSATILFETEKYYPHAQNITVVERDSSREGSGKDTSLCFAELTISKQKVFKYEPFRVQLKIYSNRMINTINGFEEHLNDSFLFYEWNPTYTPKLKLETYNDEKLYSAILKDYIFVPTKTGSLNIGNFTIDCSFSNLKTNASSTQRTFQAAQNKKVTIHADSATVVVQDFQEKIPHDFTYISGKDLEISVSINQPEVEENEPFEYEVKVAGNGNLNMLGTPNLNLPKNIHLIKNEQNNNLKIDSLGIHGERTFTFRLFSDEKGKYEIPSFSFSYFNINEQKFKRVSSPSVLLNVKKNKSDFPEPQLKLNASQDKEMKYASLIVLDASKSMLAEDLKPTREAVVVKEISNYILEAQQNIGIIAYSRIPQLLAPITDNKKSLIDSLNFIDSISLGAGSSTGTALCMALDHMQKTQAEFKNITLITDGVQNIGAISDDLAFELARSLGIPVNIIGIGGKGENAWVTFPTHLGERRMTIPIEINDEKMRKLAEQTGGQYFRAVDNETLKQALHQIEKSKDRIKTKNTTDLVYSVPEVQHIINAIIQMILQEKEQIDK